MQKREAKLGLRFLNELIDDTEDLNEFKERLKGMNKPGLFRFSMMGQLFLIMGMCYFALMLCTTLLCFTQLNIHV